MEKTVIAHRPALREPEPDAALEEEASSSEQTVADQIIDMPTPPLVPDGFRDVYGRERRLVVRHRERYAAVQTLLAEGCSRAEIGRRLGLAPDTVRRFARATGIEQVLAKATNRAGTLDPFKAYLNQRWREGIENAAALHAELQIRGWQGDVQVVRRYLRQFRTADGRARKAGPSPRTAAPAASPPPKPRMVVRWIMTQPDRLTGDETKLLARILGRSPELAATTAHVRAFAVMMSKRQGRHLAEWLSGVRADPLPPCIPSPAVCNAITMPSWPV
ncbi:hypothetical protein [Sinosporangium siamense]|uniref:HTH IS21-type domain-containing protein n=1 Tax=Sinosporangium siamense TaxID=1367973 RepID=A0A919V8F1_9ACTN|nr:hypothetical protein [Sinosporangium siamense]GII96075.1 hypothetical protein Ssi02_63060 [Sinosporangium siamense]